MPKRGVEFKDCSTLERFQGADYCGEKNLMVYAVSTYDEEQKGKVNRIVLKNLQTGSEETVAAGFGAGSPAFSPNGGRLLYLSAKGGMGRQLFVRDLKNGQEQQLTYMKSGAVIDPMWSPDGKHILFASPCEGTEPAEALQAVPAAQTGQRDDAAADDVENAAAAEAAEDAEADVAEDAAAADSLHSSAPAARRPENKPEPLVIEDFGYKFDGMGFIRPSGHMHLWVVSAGGGAAVRLSEGLFDYMHHNWADSGTVICESNRFRSRKESIGFDLVKFDLQGEMTRLTEGLWLVSYPNPMRPACTPDGNYAIIGCMDPEIAEKMTEAEGDGAIAYPRIYLYRAAMDGSGAEQIFEPTDTCYQCVQFPYNAGCGWGLDKLQVTEDGTKAVFMAGWRGQANLYIADITGADKQSARGLITGKQAVGGISRICGNRFLVNYSRDDMPERYAVYDLETDTLSEPVVQSAEDYLAAVDIQKPEDFYIDSLDGETTVHGWVLAPKDFDPEKKYPAILYIHGGPHPFYTYGFTPEHHALASEGFAVMWCNPRGTSSYGWEHQDLDKAFDGTAFYDCLQFVEAACNRYDFIDRDRIGATGGSYGGYMVNYMAGHCSRFKAYVSQRSVVSDLISYVSDMQGSSAGYDTFRDFMVDKLKSSAVSYAHNIDKPFLILHGMDDMRTQVEGAHQLYVAIKDTHPDLPVRMVLYPHVSHGQPTDPKQLAHYYGELAGWFKKYL